MLKTMRTSYFAASALLLTLILSVFSFIPFASAAEDITVELDQDIYEAGDNFEITGEIDPEVLVDTATDVRIRIFDADDDEIFDEDVPLDDENFEFTDEFDTNAVEGRYTLQIDYEDSDFETFLWVVEEGNSNVSVETQDDTYQPEDDVDIIGEVDDVETGENEVDIVVIDAENEEIEEKTVQLDGKDFTHDFTLDDNAPEGRYAVEVTYLDDFNVFVFEVEGGSSSSAITVELDKTSYALGNTVKISGEVEDVIDNEEVDIVVENPDGDVFKSDSVEPSSSGAYQYQFTLTGGKAIKGKYTVEVSYDGNDAKTTFTTTEAANFTVDTDDNSYSAGQDIIVTGKVPKLVSDELVHIHFMSEGKLIKYAEVEPEDDLTYSYTAKYDTRFVTGDYTVLVTYDGDEVATEFTIGGGVESFTVETDKTSYVAADTIIISGEVADYAFKEGQPIVIKVLNPDSEIYRIDQIEVESDGSYEYELRVGGDKGITGQYDIVLSYGKLKNSAEFDFNSGAPAEDREVYNLNFDNNVHPIKYQITGGTIDKIIIEPDSKSLLITLSADSDGELTIELPREVIDAIENNQDASFIITSDDVETSEEAATVDAEETKNAQTRTVTIAFEEGTDTIEIQGTTVIPEFSAMAAAILAVGIVGIIAASKKFHSMPKL